MIGPTGAVRAMVATKPVDFRKGAEGLAALVRETMAARQALKALRGDFENVATSADRAAEALRATTRPRE